MATGMTREIWGPRVAERLLSEMTGMPRPTTRRSPLEHEVAQLRDVMGEGDGPVPLRELDRDWFAEAALILVDAVIARDKDALDALDRLLREVHGTVVNARREDPGSEAERLRSCEDWTRLTANYVRSALDRVAPAAAAVRTRGTVREQFLRIVAAQPGVNSRTICSLINNADSATPSSDGAPKPMDEGQLSRIGNALRAEGYVFAERGARGLSWELTPRGEELLEHLARSAEPPGKRRSDMVVTTRSVSKVAVIRMVHEELPPLISFVRSRDIARYRDVGQVDANKTADDTDQSAALSLSFVIKDLIDGDFFPDAEVPPRFTVGDRLYVCTAHSIITA
jgi:hypothetical protein